MCAGSRLYSSDDIMMRSSVSILGQLSAGKERSEEAKTGGATRRPRFWVSPKSMVRAMA